MKRFRLDNKGIALITVVIGVMFCLLLTSTMLRVSLLGLQSRSINNQASDTYYDSESIIDSIRMNLQNKAALAWATTTNKADPAAYISKAYKEITGVDYPSGNNLTPLDKTATLTVLRTKIIDGGEVQSFGEIVPVLTSEDKVEGFTIKDVSIKYTNPVNGMVSYLKTDFTISAPLYASDTNYPLASYSMFAGSGAEIYNAQGLNQGPYGNPNQFGFLEQRGNVYFGYKTSNSTNKIALEINSRETMIMSGESVVINGDVIVTKYSNVEFTGDKVEVRGRIRLGYGCHLILGENTRLDCQDIVFFSSDDAAVSGTGGRSVKDSGYTQVALGNDPFNSAGDPYYAFKYASYPGGKTGYSSFGTDNNLNNPNPGTFARLAKDGNVPYVCGVNYEHSQGIVYVKKEDEEKAKHAYKKAYTAIVGGGTVSAQGTVLDDDGNPTPGNQLRVYFDSSLTPKLRQKVTFSDNTQSQNAYDQYFAEVVDIKYWEKFASYGINDNLDGYITSVGEYIPSTEEDTEGKGYSAQKEDGKYDDIGSNYIKYEQGDKVNNKHMQATFTGVTLNGTNNPKFRIFLSLKNENPQNFNSSDRIIGLFKYPVQINVDNTTDEYTALIISSEYVRYKKDAGHCYGESLLNLDTDSDKKNLKKFLEEQVGPRFNCSNPTNADGLQYCVFNNLFNGGMARFYDGDTGSTGSVKKADIEYNSNMDLIDTGKYDKN